MVADSDWGSDEVVALLVMGPLALRQLIRLLSNPSILLPLDSAAFWGAGRLDLTGCNRQRAWPDHAS